MRNLLLVFIASGSITLSLLLMALGMAQHHTDILAPARLLLFAIGVGLYLSPILLALHQKCLSTVWIICVNVLFGWTVLGWIASAIWAASGRVLPALQISQPRMGH
jgi:hypothetical protein